MNEGTAVDRGLFHVKRSIMISLKNFGGGMMKRNDKTKKEPLKEVAKLHSQINKFMAEKKKSQQYKKLIE